MTLASPKPWTATASRSAELPRTASFRSASANRKRCFPFHLLSLKKAPLDAGLRGFLFAHGLSGLSARQVCAAAAGVFRRLVQSATLTGRGRWQVVRPGLSIQV